ncbi:MAG: hypothetical protein AAB691_04955 [Patescibacteria group bacterium]
MRKRLKKKIRGPIPLRKWKGPSKREVASRRRILKKHPIASVLFAVADGFRKMSGSRKVHITIGGHDDSDL